jgi:hypothetical protein
MLNIKVSKPVLHIIIHPFAEKCGDYKAADMQSNMLDVDQNASNLWRMANKVRYFYSAFYL